MSKKKKSGDDAAVESAGKRGLGPGKRWIVVGAIVLVATGGACYAVWQQVRSHVLASSEYQVEPTSMLVTPLPRWIHTDVRAEVIRDARLEAQLSLLDPQLTVRLASAFTAHPWIARVERVSKKYPAQINVDLVYRKPVAMVEVNGGALPVDVDSVLLPSGDFSAEDADAYPLITSIHTPPKGAIGERWGDAAVSGAAQVASALLADWNTLQLARIEPVGRRPGRTGAEYVYLLVTRGGTRIYWGRAPATDLPGEAPLADKIANLKRNATENGSLDGSDGPRQLEFLDSGELVMKARPKVKPLPKSGE